MCSCVLAQRGKRRKNEHPCWQPRVPDGEGLGQCAPHALCPSFFPWTPPRQRGAQQPQSAPSQQLSGTDQLLQVLLIRAPQNGFRERSSESLSTMQRHGAARATAAPGAPHLSAPMVILLLLLAHPTRLFADGWQGLVAGAVVPPAFLQGGKRNGNEPI